MARTFFSRTTRRRSPAPSCPSWLAPIGPLAWVRRGDAWWSGRTPGRSLDSACWTRTTNCWRRGARRMSSEQGGTPLRILYVLPYVPSPIRVRPYQIIRHLARMGHAVTVAALDDGQPADAGARRELEGICETV